MEERIIVCIEGELKGAEIPIKPQDHIIVGREPRFSNLVFRDMTISRKHCIIELDKDGEYYVTDYSVCGIITDKGKKLKKTIRTNCPKGTILQIGKAGTKLMLK